MHDVTKAFFSGILIICDIIFILFMLMAYNNKIDNLDKVSINGKFSNKSEVTLDINNSSSKLIYIEVSGVKVGNKVVPLKSDFKTYVPANSVCSVNLECFETSEDKSFDVLYTIDGNRK